MSATTGFYHGVRTNQLPTALVPPRIIMSALPIVFGCAPIHRLPAEARAAVMPGKIAMIYDAAEAGARLGIDVQRDDFEHWTLSEIAYSYFMLFSVAPAVFANLFDPAKHKKSIATEAVDLTGGKGRLSRADLVEPPILTPIGGGDPYVPGVDYIANTVTGEITVLDDGAMATVYQASAAYSYAAPELVTAAECIGGYDVISGRTTGISLVDDVFPRFREVPSIGLAPKFGEDPAVAAILAEKMGSINGVFRGVAITDIPSDGANSVTLYSDVPEYKVKNNLVSPDLYLCWPKIKFGDRVMRISTQAAGVMANTDADHNNIPYASPSNKNLQMTSCIAGGEEIWLDLNRANYLNGNGIATAFNFTGGWKLWGNRTACFPDVTDPKDAFLPSRRMMAWYGNRLTLTWWQKLDWPITRRLIQTIVNSEQINLNSLTASEALLGGRIAFLQAENSQLDLIDGKIKFHVYLGIVAPAEKIEFDLEYDPNYTEVLFEAIAAAV